MAEALGLVSGIIAVLQITSSVLSVCYDYDAAVRDASWELPRIQKELEHLRTILQNLKPLAKKAESSNPAQLQNLAQLCLPNGSLQICSNEIKKTGGKAEILELNEKF